MNYVLVTIIIFLIAYIIVNYAKGKKEQSYYISFFTAGLSLITSASGNWGDTIVKLLAIAFKRMDINEFTEEFNPYLFVGGLVLIVLSVVLYFFSKQKTCVLNINGYTRRKIEPFLKEKPIYDSRERELNFVNIYKKIFSKSYDIESYECILEQIKDEVNAFKNETIELKRGYTGIAPIPFIMYAGTFLDREKIDKFYEYDKKKSEYYVLKNSKIKKYPKLKLVTNIDNLDVNKEKAVIVISITQKITDEQINQFKKDCNIIRFEVDNPCDNTIKFENQLHEYVDVIFNEIEKLCQNFSKLKTINIVCAGQSCLALEIGKRCVDTTRVPEIVSYQFEMQNDIKYPWGIIINGSNNGKFVKVSEEQESNV